MPSTELSSARIDSVCSTADAHPLPLPLIVPASMLSSRLRDGAVRLLDVRTAAEYQAAHIAGAYNVPLDTLAQHGAGLRDSVREPVVLVCQSGQRARRAEEALRSAGMTKLHVLDGGVSAWLAAGLDVVRGPARVSLERQVRMAAGAMAASGGLLALFVNPLFAAIPAFVGTGLVVAGLTDSCAMGMLLAKLPYNRSASADVAAAVRALAADTGKTRDGSRDGQARGESARDNCCSS